jgi:predicted dehydrogenase
VRIAALCGGRRPPPADGDFAGVTGNIPGWQPFKLEMAGVRIARDLDEVLSDPGIDLVDLCVPTPAHVPLAVRSLRAGKHVLCEKPLARTSAQARELVAAAAAARGHFMPAMCLRFWPGWAWLREAVNDGRHGAIRAARFRRVGEPPAWGQEAYFDGAASGGALLDLHIHDTDFVQFLFGRPRSVFSQGFSQFSGAIDHVVTQYQVASGATVSAEGSWMMTPGHGFNMAYTVIFERATADFDLSRGPEALRLFEPGRAGRTVPLEPGDGYVQELSYLVGCLREGRAPERVTLADALSAVEICEAEERSIRSGRVEPV